jgi:hypothetical protein
MCAHWSFMKALAPILKPVERLSRRPNSSELVKSRIKPPPWKTTKGETARGRPEGAPSARQNGPPSQTKRGRDRLNPGAHLSESDPVAESSSSEEASTSPIPWPGPLFRPLAISPGDRSGARFCPAKRPAVTGVLTGSTEGRRDPDALAGGTIGG